MNSYKTVQIMSARWGISVKTIQMLCENGEIGGAAHRDGKWLIPNDAPCPIIKAKPDMASLDFSGTKKKIFDSAINLITTYGYESVSIKDIADSVGIMQSAIYNHFSSKREILDTIYDYYIQHFNDNSMSVEDMKRLLESGNREKFFSALVFTFVTDDKEKLNRMYMITKIVYMRIFQDKRAQDIFFNIMNAEVGGYVREILEYGVSSGILKDFDIETYVEILIGQRHIMGVKAFAAPDYAPKQLEEEERLMKMIESMLPYADNNQ